MLKPASFLDRDGVINIEKGYVHKIEDFEWTAGSMEAIKYLNSMNIYVFVVSNQAGIARGYYSEDEVKKLHKYINNKLGDIGAYIDDFFYSPFHPDHPTKFSHLSHLRKPDIGMLNLAAEKWDFDKSRSFMIGDQETDIKCAENFGIKGYLYESGNLLDFIKKIKL